MKHLNQLLPPVDELRARFIDAKPFRHICIDSFLDPDLAEGLLAEFPVFDNERARNEFGEVGGKSTQEGVRGLGPAYATIDGLMRSGPFLSYLSYLTGIPDLEYDPHYFGGGTHDNRHGQDLDPHVDFNRDATTGKYRRLNLLIYLNKEWEESWGGSIEIHSNPRRPEENQITSFTPLFNRCVMFETHESSWHGFPRIDLPPAKRDLSRKSFSVYFYSKHPPECGETPLHSTFYVQRWLPPSVHSGITLTPTLFGEVAQLLRRRDHWIEYYQNREIEWSREREHLLRTIHTLESSNGPRILGFLSREGPVDGYFIDGWVGRSFRITLKCARELRRLLFRVSVPAGTLERSRIAISVNGVPRGIAEVRPGAPSEIALNVVCPAGGRVEIAARSENSFVPSEMNLGSDSRVLSWMLEEIFAEHGEVRP